MRFQISTSAPSRRNAQTTARAAPPAPSTSARIPAGRAGQRCEQAGRVGVVGADLAAAKLSVFAAPISRAVCEARAASSSAARLWGIVTLAPTKPSSASASVRSPNSSGATSIAS